MSENTDMTIVEFLEARVAEDEAKASSLLASTQEGYDINEYAERMLAECKAKRVILADRKRIDRSATPDEWSMGYSDANYSVVRALAAVYKDHPANPCRSEA